jgi:DNA-binding FrmR family transcriptional regulator
MNTRDKSELGSRLKRIAGQVAGIHRMLDGERPLSEVLMQLSAVRAALGSVANIVLASHVEERAAEVLASDSPRERRDLIEEMVRLFDRSSRDS